MLINTICVFEDQEIHQDIYVPVLENKLFCRINFSVLTIPTVDFTDIILHNGDATRFSGVCKRGVSWVAALRELGKRSREGTMLGSAHLAGSTVLLVL